jgi:2-dehydro-3-deoxyphosphogluconate aldolase / (4S)-4-hydroxy-2-oxoglutarate aldolase
MKENDIERTANLIFESGMVPVFYHDDAEVCIEVVKLCYSAGLRVFEFTNRGEKAFDNLKIIKKYIDTNCAGMQLGIGTIFNNHDAKKFIEAGADFVVSPALVQEMSSIQINHNKLWIPGCATLSELVRAKELGATLMKVFPADVLGPQFIAAAISVIPSLRLMPTGGVEPTNENLTKWFRSGVSSVGLGSQLLTKELIAQKNWKELSSKVSEAIFILSTIRQKK